MKIFTTFIAIFAFISAFSTNIDTVSMGPGYTNDVFYSFKNGTIKSETRSNWDIAFTTYKMSSNILVNGGGGASVYLYPSGDTSSWSSIDTAGFSTWSQLLNGEDSWENGAFSQNSLGHPDYGWGVYNMVTHNLSGDSIYIIKTVAGQLKKLWIVSKQSAANIFTFRFANIDGSNDTTIVLDCNPYDSKNYVYYSLTTKTVADREPDADTWDLVFTKYVAAQPQGGFYVVTGVLANETVQIAKVITGDTLTTDWASATFTDNMSEIGWDWKTFSMSTFAYTVADSTVYFVQTIEGDIYKLIFTGFAGSSTGNSYFYSELMSATSIDEAVSNYKSSVYPNPASDIIHIENPGMANILISDVAGKIVYSSKSSKAITTIDVSGFAPGIYIVNLADEISSKSFKVFVK